MGFSLLILVIILLFTSEIINDKNYENKLKESIEQKATIQRQLDEIITNYSDIKGYNYNAYLDNMDYRELIEIYLPELLVTTKTSRGYSYERPTEKLLDELESIQDYINYLEKEHESIPSKKAKLFFFK